MANMRLVYDNLLDRSGGTLTVSTAAGNMGVTNLLTNVKSAVWRSTATSATITLLLAASHPVDAVVLPFTNFTTSATMQVECFTNTADVVAAANTGPVACSKYKARNPYDIRPDAYNGVNSFAYGGATCAVVWLANPVTCRKVVITINDSTNPAGYLEAARLVVGKYWSPKINASLGLRVTQGDTSKNVRTDAGDLRTERGPIFRSMSVSLQNMPKADRDVVWGIFRGNGYSRPVFVSIMPGSTDIAEEEIHQMYCKLTNQGSLTYTFVNATATSLELEEI